MVYTSFFEKCTTKYRNRFLPPAEVCTYDLLAMMYVIIIHCHNMKWKNINLETRLYFIASIILLLGLGSAFFIYLAAENDEGSLLGYELLTPENSKTYVHDMELYGGKANLLAQEFKNWFVSLWHGKSLAFTIACIAIFISFGFFFVAKHLPADTNNVAGGENKRDRSD